MTAPKHEAVDETQHIWITSAADPTTGAPACFIVWGEKEKLVSTERVIATCRELHAAAAAAEDEVAMLGILRDIDAGDAVMHGMLLDLRRRRVALRMPEGPKPILRLGAFCGAQTGRPLVQIELGSKQMTMSAEAARETASDWYTTAIASIIDVRIRHVLTERDFDVVAIEDFMKELLGLDPSVRAGDHPF